MEYPQVAEAKAKKMWLRHGRAPYYSWFTPERFQQLVDERGFWVDEQFLEVLDPHEVIRQTKEKIAYWQQKLEEFEARVAAYE